jgi:hypothetical protein
LASRPETVTVTASPEVIQTDTGAREGVINSKQIDNLSIMGRSALELMRILPGWSPTSTSVNRWRCQQHAGVYRHGIRSSGNTAQLRRLERDRHRCNCGMMVSLKQRHDLGNQGPEQQTSRLSTAPAHEHQRCDEVRHLVVPRRGLLYNRSYKLAAQRPSNSIAGSKKP